MQILTVSSKDVALLYPQATQTLNTINTWHYAVGDCITILAVYKTMYENASKITLNATVENNLNKIAYLVFALRYFDESGFLEVV